MVGACDPGNRPLGLAPRSPRHEGGNAHLSKNTLAMLFSCGLRPPSISCRPPTRCLHLVVDLEPKNLLRSMQQEFALEVHRILLHLLVDEHKSALTSLSVLPRVTRGVDVLTEELLPATLHCQDSQGT